MTKEVLYKDLGLIDYGECWALQEKIFENLIDDKKSGANNASQTLILCEHPNVYTIGKSGNESNVLITQEFLKTIDATLYHIDRGGDVTYHGPGQLVGYPILDLDREGISLREYIHSIEQIIIEVVSEFGIEAGRMDGAAGVWLQRAGMPPRKICAIGVRSSRFVTMHGFALNVNSDLSYFNYINPCGFTDRGVTSIQNELGEKIDMERVKALIIDRFEKIINVKIKIEKLCQ